jgi:hypothetical protein
MMFLNNKKAIIADGFFYLLPLLSEVATIKP